MTTWHTASPNAATCVELGPRGDGTYGLRDSKTPGSPILQFDTAELDAFAAGWLAGAFGNDPGSATDAITRPLQARIGELEAERMRLIAQADELRGRIATLSGRSDLARQLADKADEYDTLKARFDDFRDICSEHSADRVVEQVRLDDAEAALKRYGDEMARLAEAAHTFRIERDNARATARRIWRGETHPDGEPGWLTADPDPDDTSSEEPKP